MNEELRKRLEDMRQSVDQVREDLERCLEEQQTGYGEMTETEQESIAGQLQEALVDSLQAAMDGVETVLEELGNALH